MSRVSVAIVIISYSPRVCKSYTFPLKKDGIHHQENYFFVWVPFLPTFFTRSVQGLYTTNNIYLCWRLNTISVWLLQVLLSIISSFAFQVLRKTSSHPSYKLVKSCFPIDCNNKCCPKMVWLQHHFWVLEQQRKWELRQCFVKRITYMILPDFPISIVHHVQPEKHGQWSNFHVKSNTWWERECTS